MLILGRSRRHRSVAAAATAAEKVLSNFSIIEFGLPLSSAARFDVSNPSCSITSLASQHFPTLAKDCHSSNGAATTACSCRILFSTAAVSSNIAQSLWPAVRNRRSGDGLSGFPLQPRRLHSSWFGKRGDARDEQAGRKTQTEAGTEELTRLEEDVLEALSTVREPCTGKEVLQLGLVQDLFVNAKGM